MLLHIKDNFNLQRTYQIKLTVSALWRWWCFQRDNGCLMFFPPGLLGKARQVQMCGLCAHVQTLRTLFPMALNSRVFHELMICTCVFSLLPSPLSMNIVFISIRMSTKQRNSLPVLFVWCCHSLVELTVLRARTSPSASTPVPTPYLLFACLQCPWDITTG